MKFDADVCRQERARPFAAHSSHVPIGRRSDRRARRSGGCDDRRLDATEEEYRQGAVDYLTVAAWLDRLTAQRRAFLQSVLRYNEDIVEYAFRVAPQDADARLLAGTLIKSPSPPSRAPAAAQRERAVENPPPEQFEYPPADREGTPRTFRTDETPADETPADGPGFESGSRDSGPAKYRPVSAAADARAWRIVLTAGGLYQGLIGAKAAERPKGWPNRSTGIASCPATRGKKRGSSRHRAFLRRRRSPALVAAYWRASEQVARYLVLADEGELLAALAQQAISLAAEPGGSVAMLRLQAARQAAQAAVLDAHIDVLTSEFELTRLAQMPLERAWIRPSTPPHGGVYNRAQTKASDRGKSSASAARVLMLHLELENLALAVVFADEYRAARRRGGAARRRHRSGSLGRRAAAPRDGAVLARRWPSTTWRSPITCSLGCRGTARVSSSSCSFPTKSGPAVEKGGARCLRSSPAFFARVRRR